MRNSTTRVKAGALGKARTVGREQTRRGRGGELGRNLGSVGTRGRLAWVEAALALATACLARLSGCCGLSEARQEARGKRQEARLVAVFTLQRAESWDQVTGVGSDWLFSVAGSCVSIIRSMSVSSLALALKYT